MARAIVTRLNIPTTMRYFSVQLIGYGVDVGGFLVLYHLLGMAPLLANLVSKPAAATFAFYGHRLFTFDLQENRDIRAQAIKYVGLLLLNIQVNSLILATFLYCRLPATPSKIAADVICVVLTYWVMKHVVFRRSAVSRQ